MAGSPSWRVNPPTAGIWLLNGKRHHRISGPYYVENDEEGRLIHVAGDVWFGPVPEFVAEAGEVTSAPTKADDSVCPRCNGSGEIEYKRIVGRKSVTYQDQCPVCSSTGRALIDSASTDAQHYEQWNYLWPERTGL